MNTRDFPLGDILSITTGCLVADSHMEAVYGLLNYMTGESLFTHQLIRAAAECTRELLRQHPQLADIKVPPSGFADGESATRWLRAQETIYGAVLPVAALAAEDHTRIGPRDELRMLRPDLRVVGVVIDPGEPA